MVGGFDDLCRHRVEPGLRVHLGQPAEPFFEGGLVGDRGPQFEHVTVFGPEGNHPAVARATLVDEELGPGVDFGGSIQDRQLDPAPAMWMRRPALVRDRFGKAAVAPGEFDPALAHRGGSIPDSRSALLLPVTRIDS